MLSDVIKKKVDAATRELLTERKRRGYLGASGLGNKCLRQTWYSFRWAYEEKHQGRLLRLFNRGHNEEHRIVKWLRSAGAEVRDYQQRLIEYDGVEGHQYDVIDWDDKIPPYWHDISASEHHINLALEEHEVPLKQWEFEDHEGHFAGHSDGNVSWPGVLPDGRGLLEIKTASDKQFKIIEAKGVISAKPVHWAQMQIYMHYMGHSWALYAAVNKNNDEIHWEIVHYRPEVALALIASAGKLILAQEAPPRYSNDPSWWECKFCIFREICHYQDTPHKNCRSCQYASAISDKGWHCGKFGLEIPKAFIPEGCDDWTPIK